MRIHENKRPVPVHAETTDRSHAAHFLVVRRRDIGILRPERLLRVVDAIQKGEDREAQEGCPKASDARKSRIHGLDLTQTAINSRCIQFHHLHSRDQGVEALFEVVDAALFRVVCAL